MYPICNSKFVKMADQEKVAEELILALCNLLYGVHDVWRSTPGGALDQIIKGDIVIEIEDSEDCFVLQVKSSEAAALEHEELPPPVYNGRQLPRTPVVFTQGKSPWELLMELSEGTGLAVREDILSAAEKLQKLRAAGIREAPVSLFRPGLGGRLAQLQLLAVKQGKYFVL